MPHRSTNPESTGIAPAPLVCRHAALAVARVALGPSIHDQRDKLYQPGGSGAAFLEKQIKAGEEYAKTVPDQISLEDAAAARNKAEATKKQTEEAT